MNSTKVFVLILGFIFCIQCSSSTNRSGVLLGQLRDDLIKQWPQHEVVLKKHFTDMIAKTSQQSSDDQQAMLDLQLKDVALTMVQLKKVYDYQINLKKQLKVLKEMKYSDQQEHARMVTTAQLIYDQVDEHVIRKPFQNFDELKNETEAAHKKLLSVMTLITPYLSNVKSQNNQSFQDLTE